MTDLEEPPNWRVRVEDADFEEGVRVVVMPCCGFSFDAIHTDLDGETYSCSSCSSERLEAENERLREAAMRDGYCRLCHDDMTTHRGLHSLACPLQPKGKEA